MPIRPFGAMPVNTSRTGRRAPPTSIYASDGPAEGMPNPLVDMAEGMSVDDEVTVTLTLKLTGFRKDNFMGERSAEFAILGTGSERPEQAAGPRGTAPYPS